MKVKILKAENHFLLENDVNEFLEKLGNTYHWITYSSFACGPNMNQREYIAYITYKVN